MGISAKDQRDYEEDLEGVDQEDETYQDFQETPTSIVMEMKALKMINSLRPITSLKPSC